MLKSSAMELIYSVNLTFVIFLNVLFFFSGICLNSLAIVSSGDLCNFERSCVIS